MMLISIVITAQQRVIEGTIVDANTGEPIPFASVGVLGTTQGTSSNLQGQFSLPPSGKITIVVTCIGYQSQQVDSVQTGMTIRLAPKVTQLGVVVVSNKPIDGKKIVRKAFSSISDNYNSGPFLQKFFYRHYCKDDGAYGRLIEAAVDVWKDKGYRTSQTFAGEREQLRVTQLRRSLDKTSLAAGHEPIAVAAILENDIAAYQQDTEVHPSFHSNVSILRRDMEKFTFAFKGVTFYDNQEVYEIAYALKPDSALTTSGKYVPLTNISGSLFIATDTYAFVKATQKRSFENNSIQTATYYRKYDRWYYPYHIVVDGMAEGTEEHSYHIELMSVQTSTKEEDRFEGKLPTRESLLDIPYDSAYWSASAMLKTTPLEDEIIRDLGGGKSLSQQFKHYKAFHFAVRDGGVQAEEKFEWLCGDSRENRNLYLVFWSSNFKPYLLELEYAKQLNKRFRSQIQFVFLSLDDDHVRWQQTVNQYNFAADGIIHYRIGSRSKVVSKYGVEEPPAFVLIDKTGTIISEGAKPPSDPALKLAFTSLQK